MSERRYYYWIVLRDPDSGKPYLIFGSDKSEEEARQKGLEMLQGLDFQIRRFATRDLDSASAMLRGKRLVDGEGLRRSTQRIGHDRSLRRLRRKQRLPNW